MKFIKLMSYKGEKLGNRARYFPQNLCLYMAETPSRGKSPTTISYDFIFVVYKIGVYFTIHWPTSKSQKMITKLTLLPSELLS